MPTPSESRAALQLLSTAAVRSARQILAATSGAPEVRRYDLLGAVPEVIGYYAEGSAALAADFYEESRDAAGVSSRFAADAVVSDRVVKIRRAVAWSAEPLFEGDDATAAARLAEVVQLESARPFRDTVLANRRRDPEAVGWRRVTGGGCRLCKMLADRGAVYRANTARFAAHPNCHCGAEPVFGANDTGETASAMQYVASRHNRTPAQRAELREYLARNFGDD
jgi:hypothetical protein